MTQAETRASRNGIVQTLTRALAAVVNPVTGKDVVAGGQVSDVAVDSSGNATFVFALQRGDPGTLVRQARAAARAVKGVSTVKVNVQLPQSAPSAGSSTGTAGSAPPAGARPSPRPGRGPAATPAPSRGLQPGSVPAPTPRPGILAGVRRVVAVSSGKGGVGKSMVATNLAAYAASQGLATGLLDADIYGPNIPTMFGEGRRPSVTGAKGSEMIVPLEAHGVRLMSLGFLLEREQPAIMRGPLIAGILKQFMEQVSWGRLDLMVVDMPPGTGDAQLSLVQTVDLDGALMVTTPQKVATGDVRRGIKMFERVNTRILGIVENMCGFQVPGSSEIIDLFGRGGGEDLARELSVPFLGRIPLDIEVRRAGDAGQPTVLAAPGSPAGMSLAEIGGRFLADLKKLPARV
ncbi:MAG: P-loop NTPase [Gemmatimonadota bacterium]|nr:P-loop NTPase [Gemmatimonadota bacterium]MDE2866166.1 P-loop NTPase [Gemmatimonadota bacterium]